MPSDGENEYLVSVYMTTYFHEKYIREALDSILSQRVSFKYEIVISDDCSEDNTQQILMEYAQKYDFIRLNFNQKNIGLSNNVFLAKSLCVGKYIIPLSGDDYWIDNDKLQRQVDFLETHPEYIGVTTRLAAVSDDSKKTYYVLPSHRQNNTCFGLRDFLRGKDFPTNGLLLRNVISEYYDVFSVMPKISPYIDDLTDCLLILTLGNIFIANEVTVAYRLRIEQSGEHNFNSINSGLSRFQKSISLLNNLDDYFNGEYDLFARYKIVVGPTVFKYLRKKNVKFFCEIYNTIPTKYRDRKLLFWSVIFAFVKIYEVVKRKYFERGSH